MAGFRDGSYIYSDERVRVNVYPSGLMEYSLPGEVDNAEPDEFMAALSAAYSMIARDATVENDVYLASAEQDGQGWNFGFNCSVGDIPVYIPENDDFSGGLNLSHNIEINVAGGLTRSYRRYVSVFEPDTEVSTGGSFGRLIGSELPDGSSGPYLSGLTLGYRLDGGSQLGLSWSMSYTNGTTNLDRVLNDEVTE
jgi:hypothetical protein